MLSPRDLDLLGLPPEIDAVDSEKTFSCKSKCPNEASLFATDAGACETIFRMDFNLMEADQSRSAIRVSEWAPWTYSDSASSNNVFRC